MMKILLSNDDGYKSSRLLMLKDILSLYGDVYVSAPLKEKSGSSISLSLKNKIKYKVIEKNVIAIKGTPADSVACGISYFKDVNFDLVVTGINYGYNASKDTLFSGTIGASTIASLNNIKSIALSSYHKEDPDLFNKTKEILEYIFKNKLLDIAPFLNVNIPKGNIKGIRVAELSLSLKGDYIVDSGSNFEHARDIDKMEHLDDSDVLLLDEGYYTITALKPSLMDESLNSKLKEAIQNEN